MNRFLLDLAALSLGGGAVVLLLLLAARLTRGRYAARWRCTAWLLLSLRLAVPFPLLPHLGPVEAPVQLTVPSNPVVFTYSPPVSQPPAASSRPAQSQAAPSRSEPVQNAVQPEAPAESGGFSLSLAQLLLILWLLGAAGSSCGMWAVTSGSAAGSAAGAGRLRRLPCWRGTGRWGTRWAYADCPGSSSAPLCPPPCWPVCSAL